MNVTAFVPEQIVHNRYLYLPLLGFLMMVIPSMKGFFENFSKENSQKILVAVVVVLSVLLFIKTWTYNKVWANDLSLWSHSVFIDSNSSFNFSQFGAILAEKGKINESLIAHNKSLDIKSTPLGYMGRARNLIAMKKYEEAICDLKTVTEMPL